jgi:hypothetical protein
MHNLQDFNARFAAALVFLFSFIDTPYKAAQWVFFIISAGFTLRRWWIMEKNNKNKKE